MDDGLWIMDYGLWIMKEEKINFSIFSIFPLRNRKMKFLRKIFSALKAVIVRSAKKYFLLPGSRAALRLAASSRGIPALLSAWLARCSFSSPPGCSPPGRTRRHGCVDSSRSCRAKYRSRRSKYLWATPISYMFLVFLLIKLMGGGMTGK